jgi:hypothetical protein
VRPSHQAANSCVGVLAVFPRDAVVLGLEGVLDDARVVVQHLVVEVAPDQLRQPDLGAARAGEAKRWKASRASRRIDTVPKRRCVDR